MGNLFITELTIPLVEIRLVNSLDSFVRIADCRWRKWNLYYRKHRKLQFLHGRVFGKTHQCRLKVIVINRYRSNCSSVRLLKGQLQNVFVNEGKCICRLSWITGLILALYWCREESRTFSLCRCYKNNSCFTLSRKRCNIWGKCWTTMCGNESVHFDLQ